jgi:hypothetical protein
MNRDWARTGNVLRRFLPWQARANLPWQAPDFESGAPAEMSSLADSLAKDLVVEPTDSS